MLIEHQSHAYDAAKCWLFLDAKSEFVASVAWKEWRHSNTTFNGPSSHRETVRMLAAESNSIDELRAWCAANLENGAEQASIHRTWVIPATQAPQGHRLHGKRDNAFVEQVSA